MIDAKEARETAEEKIWEKLAADSSAIEQKIKAASSRGLFFINENGTLEENLKKRLEAFGYKVSHTYGDQREPSITTISWEEKNNN